MAQIPDKQAQQLLPLPGTTQITNEQYNKELDEAEAEFENGDYITHEEMIKQVKKW
jgi:hypothetical protein